MDELFQRDAKSVGELLWSLNDEVPELGGLESQPESFDGVEVRRIAREKLRFEVMPVQTRGLMPGRIFKEEDLAYARLGAIA